MKNLSIFFFTVMFLICGKAVCQTTTIQKTITQPVVNKLDRPPAIINDPVADQEAASVKTNAIKNITTTTAWCSYTIQGKGILQHGVCVGKATNPTINQTKFIPKGGIGPDFGVDLTGLPYGTKLYARAYITTSTTTFYGNELTFTTLLPQK